MAASLIHYFDYKSPYAYLAQASCYELQSRSTAAIDWRPYTLDIPSYLGSAELDQNGQVIAQSRNEHQWRRVKYSYMDCRREANRHGLTLRGPRKIFDSRLAHIGFLFAKTHGDWRLYHNTVFEQFWRRELDIENLDVITRTLRDSGIDQEGFETFATTTGPQLLSDIQRDAESQGVFGVPSYLVGTELFWGAERFDRAREALQARRE
ncbi:MAG: 2-hydroxychromene-2-carboxylate isomerase [Gammaproteobacteria bacterium]|jgi:2-hydroxychromene-2-carboxylate isomerase